MNSRLMELAEQVEECSIDKLGFGEGNIEGLVRLVILECAYVCLQQRDPPNLNYKPSEKFAEAIKQHFGVHQ